MRALALLLTAACAPGAASDDTADTDTEDDLPPTELGIRFDARFGDTPARCGTVYEDVGLTTVNVRVIDLRFFVSDLRVSGPSGEESVLLDATTWSSGTVALLDFEDGSADCATTGDARTNDLVPGYVPPGDWDTLSFVLGVPFEFNHLDPSGATAPLDTGSLFWNRQTGYSFLRADLAIDRTFQTWLTQIGSGGCTSATAQDPPEGCTRPGRARVSVPFDPAVGGVVVLDVGNLLGGVPIGTDAGGPVGCRMDVLDTNECGPVFAALGMTYGSGACVNDCDGQTAFRIEPD